MSATAVSTSRIVRGLLSAAWTTERATALGVLLLLVVEVSLAAGALGEWSRLVVEAEG